MLAGPVVPRGGPGILTCMRVIISTIGTAGDVHPFIAVGQALRRRGHEVMLLSHEVFRARVEWAGLEFRSLGEAATYERVVKHPHFAHHLRGLTFAFHHLIAESVEPTVRRLGEAVREFRPDLLLRHHINFGAQWVADEQALPTAVAVLAPVSWLSTHRPCVYGWLRIEDPPRWWARVYKALASVVGRAVVDRRINRLARALGYPVRRGVYFDEVLGGRVNLALWSSRFRGPAEDDPPHGRICGFCFFDRDPERESAAGQLEAFLNDGEPPVVFTLGSSVVHHPGRFYHLAARVCRRLGRRGLLLIGPPTPSNKIPSDLPPGVRAFHYAPYSSLLPRAAAVVHHGGVGTTAQALRAGVPTVIVPFANDEFDNAYRARLLGVSRTVPAPRLSERRLGAALGEVLEDPAFARAASVLGAQIRREDGPTTAALELERLVGRERAGGAGAEARPATARAARARG
jgi:rhamnosyltransferase subunit B